MPVARVWQPARYDRENAPVMVASDSSLAWLVDLASRDVGTPLHAVRRMRHPDQLYAGDVRASLPAADEQPGDALGLQLTAAEKQALDLLASWPLCTTEQLGGLMGGVSDRRANQALGPLRKRGLVRRDGNALVLTDEGLTYLARRDRAAVGRTLDRWTAARDGSGRYIGTALRAIASQREHQRGIAEFFDMLCSQAEYSGDYELLDLRTESPYASAMRCTAPERRCQSALAWPRNAGLDMALASAKTVSMMSGAFTGQSSLSYRDRGFIAWANLSALRVSVGYDSRAIKAS